MNTRCSIKDRKCCICSKAFVMRDDWVFKRTSGQRTKYFCSWTCMRKWDKSHRSMTERKEAVQIAISTGKSVDEIARELNEDKTMVAYWYRRMQRDANEVPQQEDDC